MPPRTLCVALPRWPIQRLTHARPELRGRAAALIAPGRRGETVMACSAEASRAGVAPGMPAAEAQTLVAGRRLLTAPHDPVADRHALEKLAAECLRFCPLVGLEDAPEPGCLLMDLAGLEAIYPDPATLAARVADHFARLGLAVRLATADTVGRAWALAHFSAPLPTAALSLPAAALSLPAAALSLPAAALRLDADTLDRLAQLGVHSVDQLLALPRAGLAARFPPLLTRRLAQFLGEVDERITACTAETPLVAQWEFEAPVENADTTAAVAGILIDRLAAALAQQQRGALRIEATFVGADRSERLLELRLFEPTARAQQLKELMTLRMETLTLDAPLQAVRLAVSESAPIAPRQGTLFDQDQRNRPHELALLAARLTGRLGETQVLRAHKRASHLPERAFALTPAAQQASRAYTLGGDHAAELRRRPLTLHNPPQRVELLAAEPDGAPTRLGLGGEQVDVRLAVGPERIETGWHRGATVRRDYYRLETHGGALWVFRDLRSGAWWLHGEY
ncbi:DNA polymerase IV [Pirellulimonas nuda]|uniref:DNA polymerase IV n=1 Tax=Pirellulimonas nuda TaxID=2528009 RepID=A0A518DJ68_9BACT|nr:DNA polymerase Y family protein [Pirellulimonas nuda]QDU91482.1 DNA polymerase IV [Pirellulimonas nuda]